MRILLLYSLCFLCWGCFFMPDIEDAGYSTCTETNECQVGRHCASGYCVPPPWNDEKYEQRRLLVIENQRNSTLKSGSAIVFWVGESGMTLTLDDVTSDTRYMYYQPHDDTWIDLPVFFDVFDDRYGVWVPLAEDVSAGGRAPLVWLESLSGDADLGPPSKPAEVFPTFYNFGSREACETPWLCFGTGTPVLDEGFIRVEDNQMMVLDDPIALPFDISFKLRVNGATCENVFWGLKSTRTQSFDPPMLGFNVRDDRELSFEVYSQTDSLAPEIESLGTMDNVLHTYRIHAGTEEIRIFSDHTLLANFALGSALDGEAEYYPYLDVDGACSIEIRNLWASPTAAGNTQITPEDAVRFQLF